MASSCKGGYDLEFVTHPPSPFECSICLLTLRNPTVTSCCGNQFCEICIGRVKREHKPCPLCNDPQYTVMLHKGVMRQINAFMVYCPQKILGCHWTGELGQIEPHENLGSRTDGCDYVMVGCEYLCGGTFHRKDIAKHQAEDCPNRPVEVQFNALSAKLQLTISENTSLKTDLSKKLDTAITKIKDFESQCRILESKNEDLETRNVSLERTVEEMREKTNEMEKEKDILKERVSKLECLAQKIFKVERRQMNESLQVEQLKDGVKNNRAGLEYECRSMELKFTTLPPFYFTIFNFKYYQEADYHWQSESFYSHLGGYNLSVTIYPNGVKKGKDTHVSPFVSIVRGKNDDKLEWPFKGRVSIEIYNYVSQQWDRRLDIEFDDNDHVTFTGQPIDSPCNAGLGFPLWMCQSDVLQDYCHKGMVKFKVPCVVVYTNPYLDLGVELYEPLYIEPL